MRRTAWVLALLVFSPALFAKSLSWRAVDVTANLDRDGVLHVAEKQVILFDGDWNGGERVFKAGDGQQFTFEGMSRIDDDGQSVALTRGALDEVDHYDIENGRVRWRARKASDPAFENAELTYVLNGTYTNIIRDLGENKYRISHDFFVRDRPGAVERFHVKLEFAPEWNSEPIEVTRENLQPGDTVIVTRQLTWSGQGAPAGVLRRLSAAQILPLVALLLIGVPLIVWLFARGERNAGRRERVDDAVDERWLEQHLFSMPPEVAGAALHGKVGASEVAAMLARMTQEGKLSSEVKDGELHLHRHAHHLSGAEALLADALFFGAKETSTARIRAHYSDTGFSPASTIKPRITSELDELPGWKEKRKKGWLIVIDLLLLVVAGVTMVGTSADSATLGLAILGFGLSFLIGFLVAPANARGITKFWLRVFALLLVLAPALLGCFLTVAGSQESPLPPIFLAMNVAVALLLTKFLFDVMRTPESRERILRRKRLLHARDFFDQQLRAEQPLLHDDWMPYLIGLGLGKNVDRWFASFGGRQTPSYDRDYSTIGRSGSTSSSSDSGSSRPTFSGGGGRFGGAGATGGWSMAAAGMAAGVSAPSSSSSSDSSGGGGGGGSDSGGGSAGGW